MHIDNPISIEWKFHHLGIATRKLSKEVDGWVAMGYKVEGDQFVDPIQGVTGIFLVGAGPRLEILESLPGRNVLDDWLERGVRIYHQAFEVKDIKSTIESTLNIGAKIIVRPMASIAFGGRLIAFVMFPTMHLIEFIELG
jgi:methylmalonyl-CoA/ethylmalonyl-CoA epimerase